MKFIVLLSFTLLLIFQNARGAGSDILSEKSSSISDAKEYQSKLIYDASGFTLAEINLSNGNTIKFIDVPMMNSVYVGEVVQAGANEQFILEMIEGNVLEKYLQLTPEYVPVPKRLIDVVMGNSTVDDVEDTEYFGPDKNDVFHDSPLKFQGLVDQETVEMMDHRQVTMELNEPIYVDLLDLGIDMPFDQKALGQGSCNFSTGHEYFEDHHCFVSATMGQGPNESYCFNGKWANLRKTSASDRRTTLTRHATCGTSGYKSVVVHSREFEFGFILPVFVFDAEANTIQHWESTYDNWINNNKRRVDAFRSNIAVGLGFIRIFIKYHDNVK